MQLRHGAVGGVAAGIIFFGPFPAGVVEVTNLVAFFEQFVIELGPAALIQRFVIDKGREPRFDAHAWTLTKTKVPAKLGRSAMFRVILSLAVSNHSADPGFNFARFLFAKFLIAVLHSLFSGASAEFDDALDNLLPVLILHR